MKLGCLLIAAVISTATNVARAGKHAAEDAAIPVVIPRNFDVKQVVHYMTVVKNEIARSKAQTPRHVAVYLHASIGYGCQCSPFLFLYSSADTAVWPTEEPPWIHGDFRLTGYFKGQEQTGHTVYPSRSPRISDEGDLYDMTSPVFKVDEWCWEGDTPPGSEAEEVEKLLKSGHVCSTVDVPALRRSLKNSLSEYKKEKRNAAR
jgi:hypothetical protein